MLSHAQATSVNGDPGTLFTFTPVESSHSGEAFNPCPLPTPSLHSAPLYMDMFYFRSSCLLAALSAAQRGTNSILIGTYLGNVRNPIFLSNPCSLPQSSCSLLFVSNFGVLLISLPFESQQRAASWADMSAASCTLQIDFFFSGSIHLQQFNPLKALTQGPCCAVLLQPPHTGFNIWY